MGIMCRITGHDWEYTLASSANGDGKVIRVRQCLRCGIVENRARTGGGDYVWKPSKLVTK